MVDVALEPVPVAGARVVVRGEPVGRDVDDGLHDVGASRGREVRACGTTERWVEEVQQRGLGVDRGDHVGGRDPFAAFEHHRDDTSVARLDPLDRRRAAELTAEGVESW